MLNGDIWAAAGPIDRDCPDAVDGPGDDDLALLLTPITGAVFKMFGALAGIIGA